MRLQPLFKVFVVVARIARGVQLNPAQTRTVTRRARVGGAEGDVGAAQSLAGGAIATVVLRLEEEQAVRAGACDQQLSFCGLRGREIVVAPDRQHAFRHL